MSTATTHAPVETVGLTKVFRDFWHRPRVRAVTDVSFALEPGEVFGLLGPNGSGKSTIVKMLVGLLFPTKGRVAIFGRSPRDVEIKKRIGLLPEETYLYPYLNAEETLDLYGRILELPSAERKRRIEALIEMVGLVGARRRVLGEYSKGMARRLGIAQALIGDPDLVILDEPTTGLDPIGTREVKDMVLDLKRRGKTVLLSSHLLADVEDVCDRIAILYGGKLRTMGRVSELLSKQELTRITAANLSPDTLEKVSAVIRESEGDTPEIDHPMDRLENYFLRVVQEAAESHEDLTGAGIGGMQTSQVFGGPGEAEPKKPEDVLKELVTPQARPAPQEEAAEIERRRMEEASAEVERKRKSVLDQLGKTTVTEEPEAEEAPGEPSKTEAESPGKASEAKPEATRERPVSDKGRSLLDRLTESSGGSGDEPKEGSEASDDEERKR